MNNVYEAVITSSRKIEGLLVQLGAEGRGLHEKCTSIERDLPEQIVKLIRKIATIRNKVVHEDDYVISSLQELADATGPVVAYLENQLFSAKTAHAQDRKRQKSYEQERFTFTREPGTGSTFQREKEESRSSKKWSELTGWEKAGIVGVVGLLGVLTIIS